MSQLPPEFDEYQSLSEYDPQYTADISMNMHVPDHIDVTGGQDATLAGVQLNDDHITPHMTVPDKIIVLGMTTLLINVVLATVKA